MQLLMSYGVRSRRDNVTTVDVISPTVVKSQAKFYDLRTAAMVGTTRKIELAYARDGRIVRRVGDAYHVVHPDGRSVPLAAGDVSETCFFVGDAFVTKDDRYARTLPYGVYDTATGALRGRLEQRPNQWNVVQPTFVVTPDDRALWTDDVTSVRCWNMAKVACTKSLPVPDGYHCFGVALLAGGMVATSIRRPDETNEANELLVIEPETGEVQHRRTQRHAGFIAVGRTLVLADSAGKRFVLLDHQLVEQGSIPMLGDGYAELVPLWSGLEEFIAIDGFNRFHHYGAPTLAPRTAEKTPAAKKPAAKKPAAKKPAAKKPAAKKPAAKKRR